ncbi:hypothetical protein F2Q70_00003159 [Brassica cretica]|uniref:Uncharacterized protein n=1 Tax=Brassica cretica TaxID=69181 RepID=A0A8S9J3A1_BRACR|nr:hypothetical protein F2Q70_00003159 [Brassica cretica]
MHVIRTWCQPSDKLSVYTSMRCQRTRKQHMRSDTQKHEMSMYLRSKHVDRHVGAVVSDIMQPGRASDMWMTWCHLTCHREHAGRHVEHERFLFELRVVQGRPFRVENAFEFSWTGGYLRSSRKGFGRGFGQGVKATTNQTLNARLVFWVLRGKEGYFAARKVARVCPYAAGQIGCINHALYGEVARKHALSCDTLSGLHVSELLILDCLGLGWRGVIFVSWGPGSLSDISLGLSSVTLTGLSLARHVALPGHGVGLDGRFKGVKDGGRTRLLQRTALGDGVMQPDIWEEWWRPACVLDMQPTMWSMRCRRACVRSHAERLTGCHQPEVTTPVLGRHLQRFLFELRVVQGRPFRVRHAFEVSWDRRLLEEFKKGFWSRFRARGQSHNEPNTFAARKVARVCPYAAGQRGCIKHALYGEVARKHAPPCDTLSRLHVSYVGCSNPCAFVAAGNLSGRLGSMKAGPRHVTLPDHGVRLDGQSCSSLIVGWPVVLSSPTLGVGRPSVMFLFDCWPVVLPMLRTVRGCYTYHLCSMIRKRHWLVVHPAWPYLYATENEAPELQTPTKILRAKRRRLVGTATLRSRGIKR